MDSPLYRGNKFRFVGVFSLLPTPPFGLPLTEGKKILITLYRGVTCEAMTGWFLYSHPALRAPLAEGNKVLIPLYKRGGMRSHDGVVSLLPPRPWASFTEAE